MRTHTGRTRPAVIALAAALLAGGLGYGATQTLSTGPTDPGSTDTIVNAAAGQSQKKSPHPKGPCAIGEKKIMNKKFVTPVYEWPDDPAHVQSMPGPAKNTWEYKVDFGGKVSATFGLSYGVINAGLGFEINKTESFSKKVELNLKDKAHYLVRTGRVYKQYQFDVYEQHADFLWATSTSARCGDYYWVKKGSATALRPWTGTYRVRKVTKPKTHAAPAQQTSGITG
ncbi:hypothetical protein [Streptomyces sp. NPDC057582]|uniref:hypothetical protein n=1 Tax=Streptomyces sp. NPDC057582 TaxID=3346174 RepID=UPI0036817333